MSEYKILIIPSLRNKYDLRMVSGLALGFKSIGVDVNIKNRKISSEEIVYECKEHGYNVVIKINEVRGIPEKELKNIRVISWYQDIFCDTSEKIKLGLIDSDILYTMGDRKILGIIDDINVQNDILMTGVSPALLEEKNNHDEYLHDFSVCGFIPRNESNSSLRVKIIKFAKISLLFLYQNGIISIKDQDLVAKIKNVNYLNIDSILRRIVEENYQSLNGSLDINKLEKLLKSNIPEDLILSSEKINYYAQTYPRKIDRCDLVGEIIQFTNSLALYGPNWDTYPSFRKYHKGILTREKDLINVYKKTKINIANNTHGIGIHSRTLEVMAIGGFIATHESVNDTLRGGILDGFCPDEHFGYYRKNSIENDCMKWLINKNKRVVVGERAKDIIRNNHLWVHRAKKIIQNLKN
jgi:hypothetical protein